MQEPLFKEVFEISLSNDLAVVSFVSGMLSMLFHKVGLLLPLFLCTQM